MRSLSARYAAGEHLRVWQDMRRNWLSYSETVTTTHPWPRCYSVDREDAKDVMAQTFERVARNADRVIIRLRDLGYQFACEQTDAPYPPRRPMKNALEPAYARLSALMQGLETDDKLPLFPASLTAFVEHVGTLDLMQVYPQDDASPLAADFPRLGDWDPLVVDTDYVAYQFSEDAIGPNVLDQGGIGFNVEFAPSFEHKANVSGAMNPEFILPSLAVDPFVNAEGIVVPFTDYLRFAFQTGGFIGIPRVSCNLQACIRTSQGMFLPNHPIFECLAQDLEPF